MTGNEFARQFAMEQRVEAMPKCAAIPKVGKVMGIERTINGAAAVCEVAGVVALVAAGPVGWLLLLCAATE